MILKKHDLVFAKNQKNQKLHVKLLQYQAFIDDTRREITFCVKEKIITLQISSQLTNLRIAREENTKVSTHILTCWGNATLIRA